MAGTFFVLAATPEAPPADRVSQVIARFTGGVAFDSLRSARRSWGFLGERLSAEEAARLVALAGEAGIPARTVPAEKVAAGLPETLPLRRLRPSPEGFAFSLGTRPEEFVASWGQVKAVSAAPLKQTHSFVKTVKEGPSAEKRAAGMAIFMVTGIPTGLGKAKEVHKAVQETELFLYADIFADTPKGLRRLHVEAGKFDFGGSLGPDVRPDQLGNFRSFLSALEKGSGAARKNKGFRGLLAGVPLTQLGYEEAEDYEKELRWLLTP